jgi:hypothetical protein
MNMAGMVRRIGASLGAAAFALMAASSNVAPVAAETTNRDTRDLVFDGVTIKFSVPETYGDCTPRGLTDTLYTVGLPSGWTFDGQINVGYVTGTTFVKTQVIDIFQQTDLNVTINYPSHDQVVPHPSGLIEYHVEPQIEIYNASGDLVGTLGPGGQDWDVYCFGDPPPPPSGSGGCTPGYWKQNQHFDSYPANVLPNQTFASIFGAIPAAYKVPASLTVVEALDYNGGGINALIRHAMAAYLNASTLNFGMTPAQVVAAFQQAIAAGGNIEATKNRFDTLNNQGCPLN